MSKLGICIAVLLGIVGTARAQAPGDTAPVQPTDVEIEDAPGPDAAPPASPYDQCIAFRRSIAAQAQSATSLGERTRLYRSMPECHRDAPPPVLTPTAMQQPAPAPAVNAEALLPSEIPELRSPTTAVLLSLGTTAVGYGLAFGSSNPTLITTGAVMAFVGPTTGHFYAGDYWNAGLGFRILGLGTTFVGAVAAFDSEGGDSTGAGALIVTGGLLYVGGTLYEIATAGQAAREYNRDAAIHSLKLAPMVTHETSGLSLVGSF